MTTPKALVLVADGSEEIEFVTPYDVFVRAGFEVESVGVGLKGECAVMSRNIRIHPDHPNLSSLPPSPHEHYTILIIPGGGPGAKTISSSAPALELIHSFRSQGKWVGAICAGTTALVASQEKFGGQKAEVTSHPSVRGDVEGKGWRYSEERVVVDQGEKIVSSRGPGTALGWALKIVEVLAGRGKREEVGGPMVLAETL